MNLSDVYETVVSNQLRSYPLNAMLPLPINEYHKNPVIKCENVGLGS